MARAGEASVQRRVFVAVELSAEARAAVAAVQRRLSDQPHEVRWVSPENLHVTLKFLGETPEDLIDRLQPALTDHLAVQPPVRVTLSGLGAFPNGRRPRVLWVGIRERDALQSLFERVDAAAVAVGFAPETRPFRAHVTVGRVKRRVDLAVELAQAAAALQPVSTLAERVTLFESQLTSSGAVYSARYQVQLAGLSRST